MSRLEMLENQLEVYSKVQHVFMHMYMYMYVILMHCLVSHFPITCTCTCGHMHACTFLLSDTWLTFNVHVDLLSYTCTSSRVYTHPFHWDVIAVQKLCMYTYWYVQKSSHDELKQQLAKVFEEKHKSEQTSKVRTLYMYVHTYTEYHCWSS